jgi:hypothetical protein
MRVNKLKRVRPSGDHEVAEVERDGADFHEDLVRLWCRDGSVFENERIDALELRQAVLACGRRDGHASEIKMGRDLLVSEVTMSLLETNTDSMVHKYFH